MASGSKDRIEAAATRILARDGYKGMGMKAISDAAALPYGSIYHHFPGGKEEIAVAAITVTGRSIAELLDGLLTDGVTDRAIRTMFGFMADRLARSGWVEGCPIGTPTLDGSSESEAVRVACEAALTMMIDAVTAALVRDGYKRAAARSLATTIVATYEGATLLARAQRSKVPLRTAADAMIRLLRA
jgi:TetR/AcrR family transcriptional repressor of lmrAB and yxaGH operons